jgi:hypothetical protein
VEQLIAAIDEGHGVSPHGHSPNRFINDLSNESILLDEVSNEPAAFHLLYQHY